ncbi:MAG: bifunctional serine/threonine-protein kinase/formylglycine-generating enzyme family protein [Verrucomicrobiota bacterium]
MPASMDASGNSQDNTVRFDLPSASELLRRNAGSILEDMLGSSGLAGMEKAGDTVGPYQLREMLGEGGFGNVWRAEQTEVVQREVAVKVVKLGMDTAQVLGRFNQERQALASLDHPSIATMLDAGVGPNGRPYFAMELVRGGPVTGWCDSRQSSLPERLRLFIQICRAVQHAHDKGILHRDIKPNNVLVTEISGQPVPKIIDFGIAMALHSGSLADLTMLTQEDQVVGTPVYMSPEQIEGGRRLDARSDVYALGVLLYELLTGVQPFDTTGVSHGGLAAVKNLILETVPVRPSTRVREKAAAGKKTKKGFQTRLAALPADLDWITMRALEKDRLRRYQTAAEMAADLQRHLDNQPVMARPPSLGYKAGRWLRRHRRGVAVASLGAAAAAACIFTALHLQVEARKPKRITLGPGETHTNSLGMKFAPVPGTDVLFCIHETRNRDFAAYADEVPGAIGLWLTGITSGLDPVVANRDDHPAMRLNYEESASFCQWLSAKEGRTYRLPTDHEWSLAAGIGSEERWQAGTTPQAVFKVPGHYPWGRAWPPPSRAGNYCDESRKLQEPETVAYLRAYNDGFPTTAPVMHFQPNSLGLYDMGGNVSEWVEEWYEPGSSLRVLRGGNWGSHESEDLRETLLTSSRHIRDYSGAIKSPAYGFRCVLEAAPASGARPLPALAPPVAAKAAVPTAIVAVAPAAFPDPLPASEVAKRSLTNSLGMKFIPVPGTEVLFCIHETRHQDFAAYAGLHEVAVAWKLMHRAGRPAGAEDDHPVAGVSWQDAQDFCAWLSRTEQRLYRLPTDREWSIAVGLGPHETEGGSPQQLGQMGRTEFPWDRTFPPRSEWRAGNYADRTWLAAFPKMPSIVGYDDGFATTAPVMRFAPNAFGLFDLGGNVGEWCEDWLNAVATERVVRGAGWADDNSQVMFSAKRRSMQPGVRNLQFGFRCVLVPGGKPPALRDNEPMPRSPTPPVPKPHPGAISSLQARLVPQFAPGMTPDAARQKGLTNSLGMELLPVPGTSVLFCAHETRRRDYAAFAAETPGADPSWQRQTFSGYTLQGQVENHPVMLVNWTEAQAFCAWLSRKEGQGRVYRLPTDREWSFAVGIGHLESWDEKTTPQTVIKPQGFFPWEGVWPPVDRVANYADESRRRLMKDTSIHVKHATGYDDGHACTAPVMSYAPNQLGLYDMAGNVNEWCEDAFGHDQCDMPTRGGDWGTADGVYTQSSFRLPLPYHQRREITGFRIVLEAEPDK